MLSGGAVCQRLWVVLAGFWQQWGQFVTCSGCLLGESTRVPCCDRVTLGSMAGWELCRSYLAWGSQELLRCFAPVSSAIREDNLLRIFPVK